MIDCGILIRFVGVIGFGCPLLVPFDSILDIAFAVIGGDCSSSSCCILLSRERTYWIVCSLIGFGCLMPSSCNKQQERYLKNSYYKSVSLSFSLLPINSVRSCAYYSELDHRHWCWSCSHRRHHATPSCFHLRRHNWCNSAVHSLALRPSIGTALSTPSCRGLAPAVYRLIAGVCSAMQMRCN